MQFQPLRHGRDPFGQAFQLFHRHGGNDVFHPSPLLQNRLPLQGRLAFHVRHDRRHDRHAGIHPGTVPGHQRLGIGSRDDSLIDQSVHIQAPYTWQHGDLLVHQRLRHGRRILLVMAELAVTDDIDHDILAEFHPEIECDPGGPEQPLPDRRRSHGKQAPRSFWRHRCNTATNGHRAHPTW